MAANKTKLNLMFGYSAKEKACFNIGWRAAMEFVALKSSHNKQSTPLTTCCNPEACLCANCRNSDSVDCPRK